MIFGKRQRTTYAKSVPWHQPANRQSLKPDEKRLEAFHFDRIFLLTAELTAIVDSNLRIPRNLVQA
jgi:hypothetical protein